MLPLSIYIYTGRYRICPYGIKSMFTSLNPNRSTAPEKINMFAVRIPKKFLISCVECAILIPKQIFVNLERVLSCYI